MFVYADGMVRVIPFNRQRAGRPETEHVPVVRDDLIRLKEFIQIESKDTLGLALKLIESMGAGVKSPIQQADVNDFRRARDGAHLLLKKELIRRIDAALEV